MIRPIRSLTAGALVFALTALTVPVTGTDAEAADIVPTTLTAWPAPEYWQSPEDATQEAYARVPMPPGIQVIVTELEGPVFADASGKTLYKWPQKDLRNGSTGDRQAGVSQCTDEVLRVTSGLMSPYPEGLLLPELDERPSCVDVWPPVIAAEGAEPVGAWTLVARADGAKQWAYDGYPLYTSVLDQEPGDVLGATKIQEGNDSPAVRVPAGPPSAIPPGFQVIPMTTGRLLVTEDGFSVYTWDGDEVNKSNCSDACLETWAPVRAPGKVMERGDWTVVERTPGINQWAFKGKPLYTYRQDPRTRSLIGSDISGWHNVYTQRALPPPEGFTVQDARIGQVLADAHGMTIYTYACADDAFDQLACDHPTTPQVYRLAICGNGDPELCRETFPYVQAPAGAESASRLWTVLTIDPNTGHLASPDQANALRVWAYRDRPVYTFGGDIEPGDTNGDAYGEFFGYRNGYKAFWLRDDFRANAFTR